MLEAPKKACILVCVITVAGAACCATLHQQGTLLGMHLFVFDGCMHVCVCVCVLACVCQVGSQNRFAPPPEVVAAHDHRTNITNSVHKPARLRFR